MRFFLLLVIIAMKMILNSEKKMNHNKYNVIVGKDKQLTYNFNIQKKIVS